MPTPFTVRLFVALCLFCSLLLPSAGAQTDRPAVDDNDVLSNESFQMPPDPPFTMGSGETILVSFRSDDSPLEGAGRSKTARYGAISDGPVTLTLFEESAPYVVEVRDKSGLPLLRASGGGDGVAESFSVDVCAGDAIRITFALAGPEERGELKVTLRETNRAEGKWRLIAAHEKEEGFHKKLLAAQELGDRSAAAEYARKAIAAIREYPGYRWDGDAMRSLAWYQSQECVKNDPITLLKALAPVVDFLEAGFAPGKPELLEFRQLLAHALWMNGQRQDALDQAELAWRIMELTVREDDERLFKARCDYALALSGVGRNHESYTIHKRVMEKFGHILASDVLKEARFRMNLSYCMWALGDLYGSREEVEAVLAILEQHGDSRDTLLQKVRLHHATVLYYFGELLTAKNSAEKALAVVEETLGASHLLLQECRQSLATILTGTGDFPRARLLQEKALKDVLAYHGENIEEVQRARIALAHVLLNSGDLDGARNLAEEAMAISDSAQRKNDLNAQNAMGILARIFFSLGDYEAARGLWRNLCEIWQDKWLSKTRLQFYCQANMALCEHHLGDTRAAESQLKETFALFEQRHALSELDIFWYRANFAQMLADSGDERGAVENIRLAMDGFEDFVSRQTQSGAVREIEEATVGYGYVLDLFLSFVSGTPAFNRDCFEAVELCRSAGRRVAQTRRTIACDDNEEIAALYRAYRRANCRVNEASGGDLVDVIRKRDVAERALASARNGSPAAAGLNRSISADDVIAALGEECAGITIIRYGKRTPHIRAGEVFYEKGIPSYLAFIVEKPNSISRIDLGPAAPIDEAVEAWRSKLCRKPDSTDDGTSARRAARELKRLVWNPIVGSIGKVKELVIAPDALLATVPLDALPHGSGIVSDAYTVSYVDSLSSLALPGEAHDGRDECLVVFGNVAYDEAPKRFGAQELPDQTDETDSEDLEFNVRIVPRFGSAGFAALPGTAEEARAVSRQFDEFVGAESIVVQGAEASKTSLFDFAHGATYYHIATHGYFAPEIVRSKTDDSPMRGERLFSTRREKVEGLAPSLLSGLLLAGCGLKTNGNGTRGIVTAEEMQGLDLSSCKLVVLSACESNVGLVRAGRGIMSMQRALSVAGARGSITSLWKVDDEAPRLFFTNFYRYLWQDDMSPAAALRQVKLDMANGKIVPTKAGANRGPPKPRKLGSRPRDYTHPFYWAAFVFWGRDL